MTDTRTTFERNTYTYILVHLADFHGTQFTREIL